MHIKASPVVRRGMLGAMAQQIVEFTTDKRFKRRAREQKTIGAMVRMFCRAHHRASGTALCAECAALFDYASRRLDRCVFGNAKPTCANRVVHCYSADMRERVRSVMRWAGPPMLMRHPVLALFHKLDGRRPAPTLPSKQTPKSSVQESRTQST